MSDLVELKPCPFCNSAPNPVPQNGDVLPGGNGYFQTIWCERCDAEGGKRKTEADAIEAWNRRYPDPELSRLSALVAWQDIETAPKDGDELLFCLPRQQGVRLLARWDRIYRVWRKKGEVIYFHPGDLWVRLPAPPVSQIKDTTNADHG